MNPVSDDFLLALAQIAATLLGLLLVGGLFFLETGFRDAATLSARGGPFLRATTKFTMLLFAFVLTLSLGLVALSRGWVLVAYAVLGAALVRALAGWTRCYRELRRSVPIPRDSPWLAWPVTLGMLSLPWILGGGRPGREGMTSMLLLAGVLALASTANLLLTTFDLSEWERAAGGPDEKHGA